LLRGIHIVPHSQNVLIQMGLPVVSVDGMLIKRAKTYVLRCHACFKVTMQMDKQFCPACGNGNTLVKIAASVDRYGQTHYHTMRTRKTNLRGTKVFFFCDAESHALSRAECFA
jgi:RNA-binding protein NOB1